MKKMEIAHYGMARPVDAANCGAAQDEGHRDNRLALFLFLFYWVPCPLAQLGLGGRAAARLAGRTSRCSGLSSPERELAWPRDGQRRLLSSDEAAE